MFIMAACVYFVIHRVRTTYNHDNNNDNNKTLQPLMRGKKIFIIISLFRDFSLCRSENGRSLAILLDKMRGI